VVIQVVVVDVLDFRKAEATEDLHHRPILRRHLLLMLLLDRKTRVSLVQTIVVGAEVANEDFIPTLEDDSHEWAVGLWLVFLFLFLGRQNVYWAHDSSLLSLAYGIALVQGD
jgi:hypothetical protein